MNINFPYKAIKDCIFLGVKYKYESFDYVKALNEYNDYLHASGQIKINDYVTYSAIDIPDNIKENCIVWRIGKIREINFDPEGKMWKFYIGNKRAKRFFCSDFGVKVFPIINKIDDKYDLIGQGLAIENI